MTAKQQAIEFLRQYLLAQVITPWVAKHAEERAAQCLQAIGGIAGSWRTDYSECTYYYPQMINGRMVDLSTVEKVRAYCEKEAA